MDQMRHSFMFTKFMHEPCTIQIVLKKWYFVQHYSRVTPTYLCSVEKKCIQHHERRICDYASNLLHSILFLSVQRTQKHFYTLNKNIYSGFSLFVFFYCNSSFFFNTNFAVCCFLFCSVLNRCCLDKNHMSIKYNLKVSSYFC